MIQDISQLKSQLGISELTSESILQSGSIENKEVMLALSKIQVGELIRGKLIAENDQTMLKLENGLKLFAHLKNPILSNKVSDFLVVEKGRQHLELEQVEVNQASYKDSNMEEAIIKELQLPNDGDMKQVVGQWLDKQLPLIKNQMLQLYQLAKHYDMPSESLINMKAHEEVIHEGEMKLLSQFKKDGMQLIEDQVNQVFEESNPEKMASFVKLLGARFPVQELNEIIVPFKKLAISLNAEQEASSKLQEQGTDLGRTKAELDIKQAEWPTMKEGPKDTFEQLVQSLPKEQLKELTHHLLRKYLYLNKEDLVSDKEEMKKIEEVAKRMKEVLHDVDEHVEKESTQTIKDHKQVLEQMTQTLEKYNTQGEYFCFPMQVGKEQTTGELYFFKPKKNKKQVGKAQGMYIVLALDMPSLKHIEVHLIEEKEKLALKIKASNGAIVKHMKSHEEKLRRLMSDTVIPVGSIQFEELKETIAQKVKEEKVKLGRLDFRI